MIKNALLGAVVLIIIGVGAYFYFSGQSEDGVKNENSITTNKENQTNSTSTNEVMVDKEKTIIGTSVEGRDIVAYHFGTGTTTEILFVGGIHGGYSWNSAKVAYEAMDFLKTHPENIPAGVKVTIVPVLNPDGLNKVVGTSSANFSATDVPSSISLQEAGRFNARTVDLNRNFDCDWQEKGTWQKKTVSGGSEAFSEPESRAIKNYISMNPPTAVVVWYSSAGGVFASSCHDGVLPETLTLTNVYAKASGYKAFENFNFYEITGDMVNWLAKEKIPAISILLTNHEDTEWTKNEKGIVALLSHYVQ